ncbi:GntR family transcriptional regulator [Aureimonas fodinaquatilis]|uniref:GntR family transcriptional regulator n=1 Tax=Aureimonas fodinaquatilis TaxID=2565783 RepID=A0A5B0E0Y0_9HYPH|nr:GntR family transcriptional regulator [Aureimonas fodinaquatilis]KAA0971952.1 GntR family transcriptional regulator [Aureimonas fodinaquatilis]
MSEQPRLGQIDAGHFKNLRDHVREVLRKAILSGQFEVGQRLNERALAEELGVSTTPLKEAIRSLEVEGLLKAEARKGVFVSFGPDDAEEMSLARAAIESMIARQAAKHATKAEISEFATIIANMGEATRGADTPALIALNTRFHDAIRKASRCNYLLRLQTQQLVFDDASRARLLDNADERRLALQEHTDIMNAISAHDMDRAEQSMRVHIVRSGKTYAESLFGKAAQRKETE